MNYHNRNHHKSGILSENETVQESNFSSSEKTDITKILEDPHQDLNPHDAIKNNRPQLTMSLKNCALCGHKYKGKNKHQVRSMHLYREHFKEMFIEEFGEKLTQSLPKCSHENCDYPYPKSEKGKSALFFHYFRKHGILKKYFDKAMMSKTDPKTSDKIIYPSKTNPESLKEVISKQEREDLHRPESLENIPEVEPQSNPINMEDQEKDQQIDDSKSLGKISKSLFKPRKQKRRSSGDATSVSVNQKSKDDELLDDEDIRVFQTDGRKHSMELRKSKSLPKKFSEFEKSEYKDTRISVDKETDALMIKSGGIIQENNLEPETDERKNGSSQNISMGSGPYSQQALSIFQASLEKPKSNDSFGPHRANAGTEMASLMKSKPGPKSKQILSDGPKQTLPKHKPGPKSKRKHFHEKTAELLPPPKNNHPLLTREKNGEKKNYSTESKKIVSAFPNIIITQKNRSIFSSEKSQHMKESYLENR